MFSLDQLLADCAAECNDKTTDFANDSFQTLFLEDRIGCSANCFHQAVTSLHNLALLNYTGWTNAYCQPRLSNQDLSCLLHQRRDIFAQSYQRSNLLSLLKHKINVVCRMHEAAGCDGLGLYNFAPPVVHDFCLHARIGGICSVLSPCRIQEYSWNPVSHLGRAEKAIKTIPTIPKWTVVNSSIVSLTTLTGHLLHGEEHFILLHRKAFKQINEAVRYANSNIIR